MRSLSSEESRHLPRENRRDDANSGTTTDVARAAPIHCHRFTTKPTLVTFIRFQRSVQSSFFRNFQEYLRLIKENTRIKRRPKSLLRATRRPHTGEARGRLSQVGTVPGRVEGDEVSFALAITSKLGTRASREADRKVTKRAEEHPLIPLSPLWYDGDRRGVHVRAADRDGLRPPVHQDL